MNVGDLVRVKNEYPNTQAAGLVAIIIKVRRDDRGTDFVVQPVGCDSSWWFGGRWLETISESR